MTIDEMLAPFQTGGDVTEHEFRECDHAMSLHRERETRVAAREAHGKPIILWVRRRLSRLGVDRYDMNVSVWPCLDHRDHTATPCVTVKLDTGGCRLDVDWTPRAGSLDLWLQRVAAAWLSLTVRR